MMMMIVQEAPLPGTGELMSAPGLVLGAAVREVPLLRSAVREVPPTRSAVREAPLTAAPAPALGSRSVLARLSGLLSCAIGPFAIASSARIDVAKMWFDDKACSLELEPDPLARPAFRKCA